MFPCLAAVLLLLMTLPALAVPPVNRPLPIVIEDDYGGEPLAYYIEYVTDIPDNAPTTPVIIKGACAAGCTLFLALACVHPDAILMFRAVTDPEYPEIAGDLLSMYPPEVQQWITDRGGLTSKWLVLKGRELRRTVTVCAPDVLARIDAP